MPRPAMHSVAWPPAIFPSGWSFCLGPFLTLWTLAHLLSPTWTFSLFTQPLLRLSSDFAALACSGSKMALETFSVAVCPWAVPHLSHPGLKD